MFIFFTSKAHKDTDTAYNHDPSVLPALLSSCDNVVSGSAGPLDVSLDTMLLLRATLQRGLVHVLAHTRLLEHINLLIEQTVLFAKNVPYFMNIHEPDRIALLKSCVFDVICVRHAVFFRAQSSSLSTSSAAYLSPSSSSLSSSSSSFQQQNATGKTTDETRTSLDLTTLADCALAASSSTSGDFSVVDPLDW